MKLAITSLSELRRYSLLSPKYFKVKVKDLFKLYFTDRELNRYSFKEYLSDFTKYTGLKLNDTIEFYNVISAYEAGKLFNSNWNKRNFELFNEIIKDQNPYLNQLRGKNFENQNYGEIYFNYKAITYYIHLAFEQEDSLRMLLHLIPPQYEIIDLTVKDQKLKYILGHIRQDISKKYRKEYLEKNKQKLKEALNNYENIEKLRKQARLDIQIGNY